MNVEFVTRWFPIDNWYEKDIYAKTSDGGCAYTKDQQFLKACLIYTCLSNQNKYPLMVQMAEDTRMNCVLTIVELSSLWLFRTWKKYPLKQLHQMMKKNCLKYGIKSLQQEDCWIQPGIQLRCISDCKRVEYFYDVRGNSMKKMYDYPVLNGNLDTLRVMLKIYYRSHITDKMFEYRLIK